MRRILIIEKERIAGYDLKRSLERKGYEVDQPKTLFAAKSSMLNAPPDVIISDNTILNGKLLALITTHLKTSQPSIIYLGTKRNLETTNENNSTFIKSFSKPYQSGEIVDFLKRHFR